ncbi:hypothetical protein [Polymorphospora rubra]|uniref:hypothetical protein n=1 Tax=Polymorphospora rubra TaxID=338584 RepID=UPI0033F6C713
MRVWDEMTLEQRAVMITSFEEAHLNSIIDEYGARLEWAKTGDSTCPSKLDDAAKRRLVPRFAAVVADLVERGWIVLTEPTLDRWHDAEPITGEKLRDALHDPASWVDASDGRRRMVMVTYTAIWDRLARNE